jgi:hypothetical protein
MMFKKILLRSYAAFAAVTMLIAFAALFTRPANFKIPFISTTIIPYLDRWSVTAQTMHGPSTVVRGEHWLFLAVLVVVIAAGIAVGVINSRMKK